MRIFTCTPVAFGGGADFFARDSGLLCRGLQAIGIESRAVMPGARKPEDEPDLIRTEYRNLKSADWWRAQKLDGVVLYAWGRPKFRKVAAAIREAGIFLVLNLDSGGPMSPRAGWGEWLHAQWIYGGQGRGGASWLRAGKLILRGISAGWFYTDPMRAHHLRCGDVIGSVSPAAAEFWRDICRACGGDELAGRVTVIPHAVEPRFRYPQAENGLLGCLGDRASSLDYDDAPRIGSHCRQDARSPRQAGSLSSMRMKSRQIACVGRWHDTIQKRAWLLMDVIGRLLEMDHGVTVVIAGRATPAIEAWHQGLPEDAAARVRLAGKVGRDELLEIYRQSQVFYSPSAYESFGIAAAEALCAGCSVVSASKVTLPSFEWFVSENSGRLVEHDDALGHCAALIDELKSWQHGARDAAEISRVWSGRLHADKVAKQVVGMVADKGARASRPL